MEEERTVKLLVKRYKADVSVVNSMGGGDVSGVRVVRGVAYFDA